MESHVNCRHETARDDELEMLLEALRRVGVEVRIEPCQSDGGFVRLAGKQILFLNSAGDRAQWKELCLSTLRRFDLSSVHVPPRVRQMLECAEW